MLQNIHKYIYLLNTPGPGITRALKTIGKLENSTYNLCSNQLNNNDELGEHLLKVH